MKYICHALTVDVDGHVACYSRIGGSTHIVDAFPAAILAFIDAHPGADEEALRAHLESEMGGPAPARSLERVLEQFLALGLIGAHEAPP